MKQVGRYAVAGLEFFALIAAGYFVGHFLDGRLGTGYLTWVGLLVGAFAAFRSLFRLAQLEARALEKEDREQGAPPDLPREEDNEKDDDERQP